ncbi:ArsR family transcriptional regulator [Dictyobacter alpinus]|uniref:ArsR family transcriptional regulator n=1 Tax=Dictyobacter alpinus TaxID=2014873 RepID=A0A402B188_9CHLR|nr:ArsR family transcriptional regulator [Dictyobacter alpinus]GCE25109.1 ArsR family transcriptional regulator [Dictyobacter alpinus]
MQIHRRSLPPILKLIAHEVRWNLLQVLAESDYRVQDLVQLLDLPQNVISYHLRLLRQEHVVKERRSSVDERSSYYSIDLERLHTLYQSAAASLHPALADWIGDEQPEAMGPSKVRVLFLCTKNSSRSQMAEALLRYHSHGAIEVYSAGSLPAETIHPMALKVLTRIGLDGQQHYPKYVEAFRQQQFDYIVTLCDQQKETCPTFPGDPRRIHWSFADPALVEGSEEVRYRAFEQTALQLTMRIRLLLSLFRYQKGFNV